MSPNWLRTLMLAVSSHLLAATVHAQAMRVTLLGTGSPPPSIERFGPATLVEAGGQKLLFDVGRGATQRLWQLGIPLGQVNGVFITHLHSDHVVGLPDLWLTGWLRSAYGQRKVPLQVWGPHGTAGMAAALRQAYAEDIRIRRAMFDYPDSVIGLVGHDVGEGTVYDRDGVRVTAFAVEHGSVKPAFGYRLDFGGHAIVISGDTRRSENVVRAARRADVLIHEVTVADPEFLKQFPDARRIVAELHTSPEDAAAVFAAARPKLCVFTHVQVFGSAERRGELMASIVPRTLAGYDGRVELGEDLLTIVVGDTITTTRRLPH
jgi:ribonuclease Z